MRAVVMSEFGAPGVLRPADVPDAVAGPGQAVVEVAFSGVHFIETLVRAGRSPNPAMAPALPVVPGNNVGGRVVAVGEGVDPALVGTRVVSTTGGRGGYAELAAVEAAGMLVVPEGLGLPEATALMADGRTALALVRAASVRSGETVLVEAAAGGVGALLVQLARAAGARVVAAAGGPAKVSLAVGLGADVGVDYSEPGWGERSRAAIGGADVVFDGVGGSVAAEAFSLLRPGGRFCAFGLASGSWVSVPSEEVSARGVTMVRGLRLSAEEMTQLSREALDLAAAGRLRPVIGQTFPLDQAAAAHAAIEARATTGKTLLVTGR